MWAPLAMLESSSSHLAVSSGFFKSSGTSSRSCFPLEVMRISFPFFSIRKEWNSFSIISALVATVPSPPVSPSILRAFASRDSMYLTGFSIAVSRVASVNLAGGFVFPVVREIWLMDSCSPFLRSGRGCSQDCQEASSSSGSSRKELSAALEES